MILIYIESVVFFREAVALSKVDAEKDGVVVPITVEDYVVKAKPQTEIDVEPTDHHDADSGNVDES